MTFLLSRLLRGLMVSAFILLPLLFATSVRAADACSLESLRSRCEKVWPDLQDDDRKLDLKTKEVDIGGMRRLEDATIQIKKDITDEIRKGRSDSELSAAEKSAISKVNSVKVLDPNSPFVSEHPLCLKNFPNGIYSGLNHSIVMCPKTVNQNEAAMIATLAHEMTHAIDPCFLANDVYTVRPEMLVQERNKLGWTSPVKKSEYTSLIEAVKVSGRTSFSANDTAIAGLFPKGSLQREAAGSDLADYPFRKAYACLTKPPASFKSGSPLEKKSQTSSGSKGGGAAGGLDLLTGTDQCDINNQMGEVMSDWMAAKILGRYFERNPQRSDYDRFSSLGIYYREVCPVPPPEVSLWTQAKSKTYAKLGIKEGDPDPHATMSDRVAKVVMMEPSVRRMFGCAPSAKSCFEDSVSGGSGTKRDVNTKSGKTRR